MSRRRRDERTIEWDFFSFPVAFGFACGMFVAVILYPLGPILFFVSVLFFSFGMAHIISRWLRRRTLDKRRQQEEEQERERRALAARVAAQQVQEEAPRRRRRRRVRRGPGPTETAG